MNLHTSALAKQPLLVDSTLWLLKCYLLPPCSQWHWKWVMCLVLFRVALLNSKTKQKQNKTKQKRKLPEAAVPLATSWQVRTRANSGGTTRFHFQVRKSAAVARVCFVPVSLFCLCTQRASRWNSSRTVKHTFNRSFVRKQSVDNKQSYFFYFLARACWQNWRSLNVLYVIKHFISL